MPTSFHSRSALLHGTAMAAACCFSPLAAAQSTVTVYGAVDVYAGRQSATGSSSRKEINSSLNPNALGFAGTESLGGGLVAGFVLEGQPALDTGGTGQGGKFLGRQSNLYLQSDFGRVTIGRIHLAGRAFGIKYTATGWLTPDPLGNLAIASGSAFAPVMNVDSVGSRVSNAVMYSSPRLGGFSFSLLQSAGERGPFSAGAAKLTQLGMGYGAGAFSVDFVYNRIPELAGNQVGQTDYAVGAQYAVSGVKLMASVFSHEGSSIAALGSTTPIPGSKGTDRTYLIGASYPTGPHTVGVSYGKLKVSDAHRGRRAANMSAPFSALVDNTSGWSMAYSYALSKRTQLFAAYGALDNGAQGTASITPDLRPTAGGKSSLLASGIRHSF
ncbi:porin [Rhizobacter sp. Root1221]|uniref:porin n=1 Tax=Rhizobacter sp. Root1221 TaxID=1736433 RepID=UPI0009EA7727|nr:porin [Rhizobacter sp. Root1221]